MTTKVLVFESDSAFANELVAEFRALGCEVQVVDDGNVGLQMAVAERPDLILLSIELPRMNGFSVCNKLKKDPSLKDVPLIIMSSDSSDETFEQHRRLRTRAEDYVHKPIAFADLLDHVQRFASLGSANGPESIEDAIIIDDDIAFEESDEDELHTVMMDRPSLDAIQSASQLRAGGHPKRPAPLSAPPGSPSSPPEQPVGVDLDVEAFADNAFDRLLDGPPEEGAPSNTEPPGEHVHADVRDLTEPPPQVPQHTIPSATGADSSEVAHLRSEVERYRDEVVKLERDLSAARGAAGRLEQEARSAGEAEQELQLLHRQIEELKRARPSAAPRAGGVSSREFLDLREALNKKDKEILALRDQMSQKEKALLDSRDINLALEREKADHQDKLISFEKDALELQLKIDQSVDELHELRTVNAALEGKVAALEGTASSLQVDLDRVSKQRDDAAAAHSAELAERDRSAAAHQQAHEGELAGLREAHEKALSEQASSLLADKEAALAQLREQMDRQRESELDTAKREADERLAARERELEQARANALESANNDHASKISELEQAHASKISELEQAHASKIGELEQAHASKLSELEQAHASKLGDLEQAHASKISDLEQAHASKLGDLEQAHASKISDLESAHASAIESANSEHASRIDALEQGHKARVEELEGERDAMKAEFESKLAALDAELASKSDELAQLQDAKRQSEEERDGRIRGLESSLASSITSRDALTADKTKVEEQVREHASRIESLMAELANAAELQQQTEAKLAGEVERSRKAHEKWNQDRSSLERAKDALAAVLVQIEQVETRPVD